MQKLINAIIWMIAIQSVFAQEETPGIYVLSDAGYTQGSRTRLAGLKPINIIGHIQRPGIYLFLGKISLNELLNAAGVISSGDYTSDLSHVQINSIGTDGVLQQPIVYNYHSMLTGPTKGMAYLFKGGEVVYIPFIMQSNDK